MERKGGCCLAPRYCTAAAQQQQAGAAAWQTGRIMLKFRPIAPKPAAMAPPPVPGPTPVSGGPAVVGAGRGKRKAACGGGGRRGRKPRKTTAAAVVTAAPAPAPAAAQDAAGDCRKHCGEKTKSSSSPSRSSSSSGMTSVDSSTPPGPQPRPQHQLATLLLMPVTAAVEDKQAAAAGAVAEEPPVPSSHQVAAVPAAGARPSFAPRAMRLGPAASLVTVEEVTATWRDGEAAACVGSGSGAADDDAPAFVSDQWGRVTWRNAAFARALSADGGDEAVALGGALPALGTCAGFTCRVRVRHSSPRHLGSSVVAPCDVWRLDAGGSYLWRLDLLAALTLGGRL